MQNITIKVIIENSCIRKELLSQHGLSILIDYRGKKYLFDCGQIIEGFLYNIKSMKIDINKLDGIIISHPHYDHCGSLPKLIPFLKKQKIFVTPDFDRTNYTYKSFVEVKKNMEIEKNLFLIGPIGSKKGCQEQSVAIDLGAKGLVLIVGCSHPGIENIVRKAQEATGNKKIMGIIGGLHFIGLKDNDVEKNIKYLKSLKLDFILPGHCTSFEPIITMKKTLGDIVKTSPMGTLGVGSTIQLKPKTKFDLSR